MGEWLQEKNTDIKRIKKENSLRAAEAVNVMKKGNSKTETRNFEGGGGTRWFPTGYEYEKAFIQVMGINLNVLHLVQF